MRLPILDHGCIELVESWGSDERIIEAARMSTGKGFLGWGGDYECSFCGYRIASLDADQARTPLDERPCPNEIINVDHPTKSSWVLKIGDEKLLRFLWNNAHATPFEMGGMVIEVQAPIFVFREWHRHRTQSYNELSARYTPLPDVNYVPSIERLMINSKTNKQASTISGTEELTELDAALFQDALKLQYAHVERTYQWALKAGVPKELARVHLPVGRYSRMRASANLRNWLAFLTLRMAPNAQWEIRQYANAVGEILSKQFPRTWEIFVEGKQYG